jgi:hypothetical protein
MTVYQEWLDAALALPEASVVARTEGYDAWYEGEGEMYLVSYDRQGWPEAVQKVGQRERYYRPKIVARVFLDDAGRAEVRARLAADFPGCAVEVGWASYREIGAFVEGDVVARDGREWSHADVVEHVRYLDLRVGGDQHIGVVPFDQPLPDEYRRRSCGDM